MHNNTELNDRINAFLSRKMRQYPELAHRITPVDHHLDTHKRSLSSIAGGVGSFIATPRFGASH